MVCSCAILPFVWFVCDGKRGESGDWKQAQAPHAGLPSLCQSPHNPLPPTPLSCSTRRHGYFQSLPEREHLPLFWSEADAELLQGTELGTELEDEKANVRSDYDDTVAPMLSKYDLTGASYLFEAFQAAASLVSSRAFKVDEHVGEDKAVPGLGF